MPDTARGRIVLLVLKAELRHFFRDSRSLLWIPLALLGLIASLWPHIGSPILPVWAVVLFGLDRHYSNTLFLSPHEMRALALFPPRWREVLLGKNLAALALTALLFMVVSIVTLYFAPALPPLRDLGAALLYGASVVFPLLTLGNLRSTQSPRPLSGLASNDLVEGTITLVLGGLCSLPCAILLLVTGEPLLALPYTGITVWFWDYSARRHILPRIQAQLIRLCEVS